MVLVLYGAAKLNNYRGDVGKENNENNILNNNDYIVICYIF